VQSQALRDGLLLGHVDPGEVRAGARASWIAAGFWLATLLLCWWTPWVIIAWVLTPALGRVGRGRGTSIGSG
jgi:hypothetical protein